MDTDTPTTTEETEREGRRAFDSEARIKAGKAEIRRRLRKFRAIYKILAKAALQFREETGIQYRECRAVVETLQALQKQTNACLEALQSGKALFPGMDNSVTSKLYTLDGEKTARLILEMDLFESLVLNSYNESLSHARQRIEMHITLQDRLKDEIKPLRELINHLEQLLTEKNSGNNGFHKL